jgi:hypothetical protein
MTTKIVTFPEDFAQAVWESEGGAVKDPCGGSGIVRPNATGHEIVTNVSTCPVCGNRVRNENRGGFAVEIATHSR